MTTLQDSLVDGGVYYPDSDDEPMGDNEPQMDVMFRLIGGYRLYYAADPGVHVTGNLFWYPVQGNPRIVTAPDLMVIFGLDKRKLLSYRPWTHGGRIGLVVEIRSHKNTDAHMAAKLAFYDTHGAPEYLYFDPQRAVMRAWERIGERLVEVDVSSGWTSQSTGVRFTVEDRDLVAVDPTGRRWLDPEDEILTAQARIAQLEAELAQARARKNGEE